MRLGEAVGHGDLAQLALERAGAENDEVGVDTGHGANEHVGALVVDQPADEQHDLAPGVLGADLLGACDDRRGRLGDVLDVQAVVDDADLVGTRTRGTASCRAGSDSRS